jgi:hypothetical protein
LLTARDRALLTARDRALLTAGSSLADRGIEPC